MDITRLRALPAWQQLEAILESQNARVLSREEIFERLRKGEITKEQAEQALLRKPRHNDLETN